MHVHERYAYDADRLRSLADWLEQGAIPRRFNWPSHAVALDYFRLADKLVQEAERAREYARIYAADVTP